jgi:chemotaxis signal transduction protein
MEGSAVRSEAVMVHGTRGVIVFPVGDVYFGARVEEVAGLIDADRLAPLPRQSVPLAGVVAFRGAMVPALDLCTYLDVEPPVPDGPRYAIVIARGAERFAILVPALPRLISARELKEAEVSIGDSDLGSLIESVYVAGEDHVHCLSYWSIFDSVMPLAGASRAAAGQES